MLDVRRARPDEFREALRLSLSSPARSAAEVAAHAESFAAQVRGAESARLSQWVACADGRFVAACTCLRSEGGAALLLVSPNCMSGIGANAVHQMLTTVRDTQREFGVRLLQCLLDPSAPDGDRAALQNAGFVP